MTTSNLLVAAIAVSTALATPAFAQWRSQEPAAHQAQYPDGDHNLASRLASPATRDAMAYAPSAKSPRPTVIRATKGQ
jgi:predicted lipid-binding transport protein (Tim44 family)